MRRDLGNTCSIISVMIMLWAHIRIILCCAERTNTKEYLPHVYVLRVLYYIYYYQVYCTPRRGCTSQYNFRKYVLIIYYDHAVWAHTAYYGLFCVVVKERTRRNIYHVRTILYKALRSAGGLRRPLRSLWKEKSTSIYAK